jgi:RNA polymerase sigma-B factor
MKPDWRARASARDLTDRDIRGLFECCLAGDAQARETIIVAFLPYACRLARRFEGQGEPAEDLCQAASVGLIKAVDRFEPARGVPFFGYAKLLILGELRRHFRDTTWRVHAPRGTKERAARVARAETELRARSGSPGTTLIARHAGLDPDEVSEARGALRANRAASLDAQPAADGARLPVRETVGHVDPEYERVEASAGFWGAAQTLTPRDRTVLLLRVACEMTQDEIASRIGVSQMHVSRILRHCLGVVAGAEVTIAA